MTWIRPRLEMLSEESIKGIIGEARLLLKRKGVYINHRSQKCVTICSCFIQASFMVW